MEVLIFLIVGAGVLVGLYQAAQGNNHAAQGNDAHLRAWQNAVKSCGLQIVEASTKLQARAGPITVRIEDAEDRHRYDSRVVVEGPAPPGFQHVKIRPEALVQLDREIAIGHGLFDRTFFIAGPTQLVLALLDAEVRRLLLAASSLGRLEISYGELEAMVPAEKAAEILPLLLDIRKRFVPPVDIPRRLAENASQDPEAGVRLQNLLLLIRELPDHPETAGALRRACSDSSPEIRLRAAMARGAEGRATLLEVAGNLQDDAVSVEAVSALGRELPVERARAILVQALSLQRFRTARACVEALGRGGAAAVDKLVEVLTVKDIELAAAAAQALGEIGSPAAEPPLIQALQREHAALQIAAANALARVGSVAAVLPLKEANERSRLDLKLRRATRQAIAEIQTRAQGASPGQLSLAGMEAGQLSLADDPAGQVSLTPEERPE